MIEYYGIEMYLSAEARAWRATDLPLPARLAEALTEAYAAGDAVDMLEPPTRVKAHALRMAGTPAREAVLAEREAEIDRAAHELEHDYLARRAQGAAARATKLAAADRDEVIGLANEALRDLIAEAREVIAKGIPNEAAILANGKEADLKRLRAVRALETRYAALAQGWSTALKTHADTTPSLPMTLTDVNGAFRYFTRPDLVKDDVLAGRTRTRNGQIVVPSPTLLDLALQDEAVGVRLATFADLARVYGRLIRTDASKHLQIPYLGVGRHDAYGPDKPTDGLVIA